MYVPCGCPSGIVGRYLFYSGSCYSSWGANPIAPDKLAKLPATGPATFSNVSTFARGLTGIYVDIADPANGPAINASDFEFVYGNTTTPATWTNTLDPTSVTSTLLSGTTYRVKIVFPSYGQPGAMPTRNWLKTTIKPGGNIGLFWSEVFFFGLCIGETGASNTGTAIYVGGSDYNAAYSSRTTFPTKVPITNSYDFNKDGQVTASDYNLSYAERGNAVDKRLLVITP